MKVLIASDAYYPIVAGSSYFTQRLAHGLAAAGHEVAVIAPGLTASHARDKHDNVHIFGVRSFGVFFYPGFRFVVPLGISRYINEAIRDFKPDIVHIQMHFPISRATLAQARKLRIPVVATNHFMPENITHYLHLPRVITNIIHSLAWRDAARVYSKTHGVTAPTRTASVMLEPFMKTSVLAISNGIDLKLFNPLNDATPAKQTYALPRKPLLLFVGRLDKEKNVDVVLQAFACARKKVDFHFVVTGSGAEKEKLKKLAGSLGIEESVTFTGFVPDTLLPSLYAAAQVFVIAGTAELQCIVAMEAMATGLPVLGARAVALPELIHHGVNGFLFEPGDSAELAERLVEIFNNQEMREAMGKKSLEIIAHHNIDLTLEAFEDFYRQALIKK